MSNEQDSKKRIGILTFPCSVSYGAVLQMYALYRTIELLGYNVEIIHYFNAYMSKERHLTSQKGVSLVKMEIRQKLRRILHRKLYHGFKAFEEQMIHYPHDSFSNKEFFKEVSKRYQAVICGSDQVWNPKITGEDLSFFLDFCGPKTRRIAYAPSFGTTRFPEEFDKIIARELMQFFALSVREAAGQEKVRDLIGQRPDLVLDPVFLLSQEDWNNVASSDETKKPYVFYYSVWNKNEMRQFCQRLAKEKKLTVIAVGKNILSAKVSFGNAWKYVPDIDPTRWLQLLSNAEYVVTDSFHGLAFSIIYRKKVYISLASNTNARLEHLISLFKLKDQIIQENEPIIVPDYTAVDRRLPELREHSIDYLKQALHFGDN